MIRTFFLRMLSAMAASVLAAFHPGGILGAQQIAGNRAQGSPRYDRTREIACHNCYSRDYFPGSLKDALGYVHTIEVDFMARRAGRERGFWPVTHTGSRSLNSCGEPKTKGLDLAGCLHMVNKFLLGRPTRHVITIYLDRKVPLTDRREMKSLDSLAVAVFGDRLFTPHDLTGRGGKSPAAHVRKEGWPTHEQLRGRVLLVLTGGGFMAEEGANKTLGKYAARRGDAAMFVAPAITVSEEGEAALVNVPDDVQNWIVFGNLQAEPRIPRAVDQLRAEHWVTRVWGGDRVLKCILLKARTSHVALYRVDQPFRCSVRPDNPGRGQASVS